jgi:hypothetical protein
VSNLTGFAKAVRFFTQCCDNKNAVAETLSQGCDKKNAVAETLSQGCNKKPDRFLKPVWSDITKMQL